MLSLADNTKTLDNLINLLLCLLTELSHAEYELKQQWRFFASAIPPMGG
jgi:hypothetical protein